MTDTTGDQMSEHATEIRERVEVRYGESYCIQPDCEYFNKPSVQGHCHSRVDTDTLRLIDRWEKSAESILAHTKEHNPGEEYVEALESQFVCAWMNYESVLDQLVELRRWNAALRLRLGEYPAPTGDTNG